MMRSRLALVLLALAAPAAAQERPNMPGVAGERTGLPDVNPRRDEADPDQDMHRVFADFGTWSRRERQPKILLFWNRELSDDTTTRYREREQGVETTTFLRNKDVTVYDRTREMERTTGGKHAWLDADDDGQLESGFVSAFVRTGANILDRKALMRKVSARSGQEDRSDQQYMESVALEQGVDYLVEVLPEYRDDTATGMLFSVKITHLPTSQVRAQFRTPAQPAAGPERMVAAAGGFQRRRDDRITIPNMAEALAADTMGRFF